MDADSIHKGGRLDVYFEDDRDTVYCVEVQNQSQGYLSRRSRHYQSVIDVKMLPVGEADYRALRYVKDSVRVEPKTDLVKKVAERVRNVKRDQSMEARYMMSLVHDNEVRMEGEEIKLIELVVRKWDKGMPVGEIVEFLEEPAEKIQRIVDVMERTGKREPMEIYGFLLSDNETEELESPGLPE